MVNFSSFKSGHPKGKEHQVSFRARRALIRAVRVRCRRDWSWICRSGRVRWVKVSGSEAVPGRWKGVWLRARREASVWICLQVRRTERWWVEGCWEPVGGG